MKKLLIVLIVIATAGLAVFKFAHKAVAPTSEQSLSSEPTTYNLQPVTLFFAGDIMLSRNVAGKIIKAKDNLLPFRKIADATKKADISFANLESPFIDKPPYAQQGLIFKADPQTIEGLQFAGFDVLSTANNHALDQGVKGLEYTIDHLMKNNIIPSGTKKSIGETILPVINKHNVLYGFLSYSYAAFNDGGKSKHPQIKDFNDIAGMKKNVLSLKDHNADVVIVSMHAGTEYQRHPNQNQIDFARAAIDAGADLVIGTHPHWIQTIEQYKDKWIFYSLGNFVFDQMWSTDTKEGLTVLVTFRGQPSERGLPSSGSEIAKIEIKPIIIENYCCPRWASETETQSILKKIGLTETVLVDKND